MKRIVIFGPGPQFKGGIANYTTSLAKSLSKLGAEVYIVSWTQQYPSIIPRDFIDRSSKKNFLEGTPVKIEYITNYNNPFSWNKTVKLIKSINPDIVVFQWAISVQGMPMGYIAKKLKTGCNCEIIFDLHVVAQKESSILDKIFLKYALKKPHTFIVHSLKTFQELQEIFPKQKFILVDRQPRAKHTELAGKGIQQVIRLYHPIYDMFTPDINIDREKIKAELGLKKYVFLFSALYENTKACTM
ncbi:glycosyltransferase family 4 protein [Melioribacter roseus]|uniref:glycosyltransferase family 4 protein n=1 Tax=Melioribacter roseus TaxID=1134405 RepID=UPI0002E7B555|nr:glycosyltransferase family 4 protein [Melioribacter roseus]